MPVELASPPDYADVMGLLAECYVSPSDAHKHASESRPDPVIESTALDAVQLWSVAAVSIIAEGDCSSLLSWSER